MHYYTVREFPKGKFDVVLSWTHEDTPLDMTFDESVTDIKELAEQIDRGFLDYFIARVQFFYYGMEVGSDHLGGCLYDDVTKAFEDGLDGYLEDMIDRAEAEAILYLAEMKTNLEADFPEVEHA